MMNLDTYNLAWLRSLGRVFLGALFVYTGFSIISGGGASIAGFGQAVASTGIPVGLSVLVVWIILAIKIIGGGMLILGWHSRIAAASIILFVALTILLIHNNAAESVTAFKNLSIIGGLLYVIASGPGPYTIVSLMRGNAASEAARQNQAAPRAL